MRPPKTILNHGLLKKTLAWVFSLSLLLALYTGQSFAALSGISLLEEIQQVFIEIAEEVKPAVVNISPLSGAKKSFSRHGGRSPDGPGSGSGVILDKSGYIITNNHVVGNAQEVEVRLSDKRKFTGKVIGNDKETDVALVKIESNEDFPFVPLGDSEQLKVGQWALAVGNPFGLDRTVTVGIISGLGRETVNLTRYENFIQTDASINPGNSGGPLFNIKGEVIGINTAIINFAQGIGFAIPSNMAQNVVNQLKTTGKVTRGWLGVGIQPLTEELSKNFGSQKGKGVLVNEIFEGDPAEQAGIQPGDIITMISGKKVNTPRTLARIIASVAPGEEIPIEILRDGKKKVVTALLAERKMDVVPASISPSKERILGFKGQEINEKLAKKFKIEGESGIVVTEVAPDSPAENSGLKIGDVIKEINRQEVNRIEELNKILDGYQGEKNLLFRINRENRSLFLVLKPKEK